MHLLFCSLLPVLTEEFATMGSGSIENSAIIEFRVCIDFEMNAFSSFGGWRGTVDFEKFEQI